MTTKHDARIYAAKIHREIADEALTATYYADHVDLEWRERIKERELQYAEEVEAGKHDHNLTIAQRMHYFLTGESVALLIILQITLESVDHAMERRRIGFTVKR